MRLPLIVLTTLCASTALGQTTAQISLTLPNNATSLRVPREPCDRTQTVNYAYASSTTVVCSDLKIWLVQGSSCSDEPTGTFKLLKTLSQNDVVNQPTGTVTFNIGELPGFTGAVTCPANDREDTYRVCASIKLPGGSFGTECGSGSFQRDDLEVVYDAKPPSAPTLGDVTALDSALSVSVTAPDDAEFIRVTVAREDGTDGKTVEKPGDLKTVRVEGLKNGVKYTVVARAVDEASNESAPSAAKEGTPEPTRGFLDRYDEAGGEEMGGCGAAGGGVAGSLVLAVLGFWLSSRRNRS
ncbi:MXAN_2561 family MXYO-CTERM-anchored protein [Stigmatella hybrida]|uniref:MXAN_2561 family MXYO-CTERM-anchored protein n=1 Tax=Stigmatella hybrida TaxID=394097 RepID=UPI001CDAD369|nr:MXAN_2561 family MXYO-CTERM-anchored protein [Stigmatella hybrida]